ncbi:MAG: hypothetical protein Q8941_08090 [Bacteroidota bacterium]|nr:hypothetical protein [Bacteroidota bacterium]
MKKQIVIAGILITCSYNLFAQTSAETSTAVNKKFITAMEANLKILDTASNPATFILLANNFERIGKAEQKQWQPFYHAAFCYAVMALNTPDKSKTDLLADKAESYLTLADDLEKNNSEVSALRAMILYARVLVDPTSRWQTMSKEAADDLAKAKEQNPANPRPYLIEANSKLRTPEGLGGGPKTTKPIIEECLNKYNAFVPENSIAPNWGKGQAEKLLKAVNPQ